MRDKQILAVYFKGLIGSIRTIVKCRNPETFEQTKQIARSKKIEFNSDKEAQEYIKTNSEFENRNKNYLRSNNNFHHSNNNAQNNNSN